MMMTSFCFLFFFPPISTENLKPNHLHFSLTFRTNVCRHRRSCTVKDAHSFDTWNENGKRLSQDAEIKHQTHTHNGHIGKQLSYWQKKNLSGVPPRQSKKEQKKSWRGDDDPVGLTTGMAPCFTSQWAYVYRRKKRGNTNKDGDAFLDSCTTL